MEINEKKLTPNELKKREEIAKSMERDNPDMPMDKKMAIATSVAKRVAEAEHTVPKSAKEKDLAAAAYPHDKITHKDVLVKRGVVKEKELVEFAIGTKVHHPYLGPKGGEVVKPESNGFNTKTHDAHVAVKAHNGKVYRFAAHSLKRSTSDKEVEHMQPLTHNRLRKEDVIDTILSNIRNSQLAESAKRPTLSFKEFSEVFEDVILENSPFGASQMAWLSKKGDKPAKSDDKKGVGRPKGEYGSYKIDKSKRQDPEYKKALSDKVKAAKADGFAARKEFKDLMNAALKKREEELFGSKNK
jgi:hypothetical protein